MPASEYTGDFGTLRIETDMIDVTSGLPYADPAWTYTDQQGHEHRYEKRAPGDYYPTLRWFVTERYWCDDCGDEHTEGEWVCPLCDEVITPGLAGPDLARRYIPGLTQAYLNDEPITEAEAKRIIAAMRQQD